jgi:thiamine biosynthesis protein ThiS
MDDVKDGATINLQVNGRPRSLESGASVLDLLGKLDLHERLVVVELNGTILKRSTFGETGLSDGDVIEIAHFVGGG